MAATSTVFELDLIHAQTGVDHIHWESTVDSTNTLAIDNSSQWAGKSRVLVLADEQTAGRGRGSNQWWSHRGSLTMSLWLGRSWADSLATLGPASLTIGNAICDTLEQFRGHGDGGRIGLKWPNDIWLDDRKLGGVLVEKPAPGGATVVGIGLNLNNTFRKAPWEVQQRATSTCDHWQRELPLSEVVIALVRELQVQLKSLLRQPSEAAAQWQERSVLDNRTVLFRFGDRSLQAVCRGIDRDGSLILQTEHGVERFLAGTIERVMPVGF